MNSTNTAVAVKPAKVKKAKPASLDKKKARSGWFFVLPFVLIFLLVYVPIIFDSIRLSFNDLDIVTGGGYELTYIGLDNYETALFTDAQFVPTLVSGMKQLILDIPAIVIFSLFMAILLNDKMAGRTIFRAIFFIPVILSTGIIDSIDQGNSMMTYMSNTEGISTGAEGSQTTANEIISAIDIQKLFANMKVGQGLVEYVVGIVNDIYNVVNRSGVQMLIFLSGLQSINPAIYESCKIDGASAWETFWKITFPMISPMILVNTVYTVIDSFTSQSNQVMSYIRNVYNQADGWEISSAMSWMYFMIVILLIAIVAGLLSMYIFYQRRD